MHGPLTDTVSHKLSSAHHGSFHNPSFIFGHLVELAIPVLTSFYSDLYYDANWVRDYTGGLGTGATLTFHYYVSDSHTSIDSQPVDHSTAYPDAHHWVCTLHVIAGWWTLDITQLA